MSKTISQEQANMAIATVLQRQVADLERQLVEAKAEIDALKKYFFMHENCRFGTGLCRRAQEADAALLASVDLLAEKQAEIEAMRPVVEAAIIDTFADRDQSPVARHALWDAVDSYVESRKKP